MSAYTNLPTILITTSPSAAISVSVRRQQWGALPLVKPSSAASVSPQRSESKCLHSDADQPLLAGHRSLSASARILGGHWLLRSAGCYERGGLKVDGCIVELSVERRVHFGGFGLGDLRAMGVLKLTEQERRIAARCSAGLESARISCLPGDRPSVGQPSTPCGERPLWRLSSANYRPSPVVHRAWSWTLEGAATVDCA